MINLKNKKIFTFISFALFLDFYGIFSHKSFGQSKENIHNLCLEANYFEGCIKAFKGEYNTNTKQVSNQDICLSSDDASQGWCIAGKGEDLLKKPKISGWNYREIPEIQANYYFDGDVKKLKVNGSFNRYLVTKSVFRKFREYKPTIPGREIVTGKTITTCRDQGGGTTRLYKDYFSNNYRGYNSFDSYMRCETSAPSTSYIPTKEGNPEGVYQKNYRVIIDCKSQEQATVENLKYPRNLSNWTEIFGIFNKEYCYENVLLPESDIEDYSNIDIR